MNQNPQQQPDKMKRALTAPFTWLAHHPLFTIFIVLLLVCAGLIGVIAQATNMNQAPTPTPVSKSASTPILSSSAPLLTPEKTAPAKTASAKTTPTKTTPATSTPAKTTPTKTTPTKTTPAKTTPTSSSSLKWMTAQTFTGYGVKKTPAFTAPKNWRVVWSCDLSSHHNASYDIIIHANTVNNALLANSVETTCNQNNTHSYTDMHQAGKIYLSILSEGTWQVQVQFAK